MMVPQWIPTAQRNGDQRSGKRGNCFSSGKNDSSPLHTSLTFFGQALHLGGFKVRHVLCKHTSEYNVLGLIHVNTLGVLRF